MVWDSEPGSSNSFSTLQWINSASGFRILRAGYANLPGIASVNVAAWWEGRKKKNSCGLPGLIYYVEEKNYFWFAADRCFSSFPF